MTQNKNHDDIIDVEVIKDPNSTSSSQNQTFANETQQEQYINSYAQQSSKNESQFKQNFYSYSWGTKGKNPIKFKRPNILMLILLSPFFLILFVVAFCIFLIAFIFLLPKAFRAVKVMRASKGNKR